MHRVAARAAIVFVAGLLFNTLALAQTGVTIRTLRSAPVLETPRGDSMVVGTVPAGAELPVLEQQGDWFRIEPPKADGGTWKSGWVYAGDVEVIGGSVVPTPRSPAAAVPGRTMFRGFVQAGGAMFAARDTFETILGSRFGLVYGAGGQIGFSNGAFIEVGVSRFEATGSRTVVSANQVFRLDVPHTVTLMPIEFTVGYRKAHTGRTASYLGVGVGWHRFEEATPSLRDAPASSDHVGYHLLAGAEHSLGPWLSLAGEAQWATVPKALGDGGVSAVFEESDLGGATFRLKILVGR